MLSNVLECCADRRPHRSAGEVKDVVMRDGFWRSRTFHCAAVAHDTRDPDLRADHIGFRVACRVLERR
jgi:formylglycine-generating enzyme required for sulfatase activity